MQWRRSVFIGVVALCALISTNTVLARSGPDLAEMLSNAEPACTNARIVDETSVVEPNALRATPAVVEVQAEPDMSVAATANDVANLRGGPGTDYPVVDSAQAGQVLTPVGMNADGSWYLLDSDHWIAAFLVDNAPAALPVAEASPAEMSALVESAAMEA